jgi:hypothetical protein
MPCESSYMEATPGERELSRVLCLIEEISDGKKIDPDDWAGYHEAVYGGVTNERLRSATAELCGLIEQLIAAGRNLGSYSLELQMWWRDHQVRDRKRVEAEQKEEKRQSLQKQALAKLSPEERAALGIGGRTS